MNLFDEPEIKQGRKGMGSHQSASMLKDAWLTPPEIIRALGGPQSFHTDPCSPINRPWDTAQLHYTIVDDGLRQPWFGRVWLNPPYGGKETVGPWMRAMVAQGRGTALIFARTETEVFFQTVWRAATAVLFLEGRLHFYHGQRTYVPREERWFEIGERASANAGAPSVLIAYGEEDAAILRDCGIAGQYIKLR